MDASKLEPRERLIVVLVLAVYVLLALAFSSGPIFEPPDEIEHYRYIRHVATNWTLPDPRVQYRGQYHHAPLYYALVAPVAALLPDSDFDQIDGRFNPYYPFEIGVPGNDNKNLYLHTRAEDFPYTGSETARAVHLLRLTSIVFGSATVWISYLVLQMIFASPAKRLIALGIVSFQPQFVYLSSALNNDNLLFLLSAITLFLLIKAGQDGMTWRTAASLGVTLGLVLLTKLSAAFLVFPVGAAILLHPRWWRYIPLTTALVVGIAAWWYVRNWALYGDPTLVSILLDTWRTEAIRPGQIALDVGLQRIPYSYATFWARFGQGAVPVSTLIYTFFDGLLIIAGIGWLARIIMRHVQISRQTIIIVVAALTWIAALVYYASTAWSGNQGRYLLPALVVWAAMLVGWLPRRVPFSYVVPAGFAAICVVCVFGYFLSAYRSLPPQIPITPLYIRFGEVAELVGISPANARPGQQIAITLHWRALDRGDATLQSYLHSVGSDVVKRDSVPGTGNLPASEWEHGLEWSERYIVPIPADAPPQNVHSITAGLYDPVTQTQIPAFDTVGEPIEPIVGRIAIHSEPQPIRNMPYTFANLIGMEEPEIRDGELCFTWQALEQITTDYNIFVHLTDSQHDFRPRYPTSAWQKGELVQECIPLEKRGEVRIGMYTLADFSRLSLYDVNGVLLLDSTLTIP